MKNVDGNIENRRFIRQSKIFANNNPYTLFVIGAGSVGSWFVLGASKMGFKNIVVLDYDKVEEHNITNQVYGRIHIGEYKVDALKKVVKDLVGVDIVGLKYKFDVDNLKFKHIKPLLNAFDVQANEDGMSWDGINYKFGSVFGEGIWVLAVDSHKVRKKVLDMVRLSYQYRNNFIHFIDMRVGGENYSVNRLLFSEKLGEMQTNPSSEDVENGENYLQNYVNYTELLDMETSEESCGENTIIYSVMGVVADALEMCKSIVMRRVEKGNFDRDERINWEEYKTYDNIPHTIEKSCKSRRYFVK